MEVVCMVERGRVEEYYVTLCDHIEALASALHLLYSINPVIQL